MAFEFGKGIELGRSDSILDQSFVREDYMRSESFATDADLGAEESFKARKFSEIMTQADGLTRKSSKSMTGQRPISGFIEENKDEFQPVHTDA